MRRKNSEVMTKSGVMKKFPTTATALSTTATAATTTSKKITQTKFNLRKYMFNFAFKNIFV